MRTTGKIQRFHLKLSQEFLTGKVFEDLARTQAQLDALVVTSNRDRPHPALNMSAPVIRSDSDWATRKIAANGCP